MLLTVLPRVKKEELGFLSKSEPEKLQRPYTQGFAAYGSVRNLAKAAKLSPSKVREFLHSKTSYTRYTQATRKFKRMRAFARFKNEIWCMDLAYVDKLANDNNGVKCLLVRQDLFGRMVDAKGMKTEESKETVRTFSKKITKKNRLKKIWVNQGTENAGNNLYRNTEDYGYKYFHKLPQFIATMTSRNNRSIDMKHNHVRNSNFMSILYSKALRENKKPKFGI